MYVYIRHKKQNKKKKEVYIIVFLRVISQCIQIE